MIADKRCEPNTGSLEVTDGRRLGKTENTET